MCHLPLCERKRKKRIPAFLRLVHLICAHIAAHLLFTYYEGGESKTDGKPPLSEHQHKYKYKYRTFEMPKDSSSP